VEKELNTLIWSITSSEKKSRMDWCAIFENIWEPCRCVHKESGRRKINFDVENIVKGVMWILKIIKGRVLDVLSEYLLMLWI
jgi:hypothetical protein